MSKERKFDSGYKRNLKRGDAFLHFLKKYINEPWTRDLKVENMRLCSSEFIMGNFTKSSSDIIWELQLEDQAVYVYVIQELQSEVDYTMPFRTLVYTVNMLLNIFVNTPKNERERKGFQLPVVVAVVFYNGDQKWTVPVRFQEYQKGYELFEGHAIQFSYYLVNLEEVSKEYIFTTNTLLDNILAVDKVRQHEELPATLNAVEERMEELGEDERKEFLVWLKEILMKTFPEEQDIETLIRTLKERRSDAMVYSIERIYKKRLKEDLEVGIREGVEKELKKAVEKERAVIERKTMLLFMKLKDDGKEELFIQALKDKEMKDELYQQFGIK